MSNRHSLISTLGHSNIIFWNYCAGRREHWESNCDVFGNDPSSNHLGFAYIAVRGWGLKLGLNSPVIARMVWRWGSQIWRCKILAKGVQGVCCNVVKGNDVCVVMIGEWFVRHSLESSFPTQHKLWSPKQGFWRNQCLVQFLLVSYVIIKSLEIRC